VQPADDQVHIGAVSLPSDVTTLPAVYRPAVQAVHMVAAGALSVSVIEPALHAVHSTRPTALVYWPGVQSSQATVEMALYCPDAQPVQLVPPAAVRVSVIEPGVQLAQTAVELPL
jgi:hypothetical protein